MVVARTRYPTLTLWSPLAIIACLLLVAVLGGMVLGVWVWVPILLVYWALIIVLFRIHGGSRCVVRWVRPSMGGWYWKLLALLPVLPLLPTFAANHRLLGPAWVWLPTVLLVAVDPTLEEMYWRGLLLDGTRHWPAWLRIGYSSALFALVRLALGVHSLAGRQPVAVTAIGLMGVVWAIVYIKTKSLRWAIVGHTLVDILSLTVPALLNLYVPPG